MPRIDMHLFVYALRTPVAVLLVGLLAGCVGSAPRLPATNLAGGTVAAKAPRPEPPLDGQTQQAYERALAHLKAERFAEAERELVALTARAPQLAGPHANLGILYRRLGKTTAAIAALERAIALNPRAAHYNELGMAQRADGRFDRAKQAYENAIDLDADYAYAHLNLGILYDLYLQQPDKALTHYERYQVLAPNDAGTVGKWIADLKRRTSRTADQSKRGRSG